MITRLPWRALSVACWALLLAAQGCAGSECRSPEDASPESEDTNTALAADADDRSLACRSSTGRLFVGPFVGLTGTRDGVCGELSVFLYDEHGTFIDAVRRSCRPEANFIDLGSRSAGRYQLAVDAIGAIGGGGALIRSDFCVDSAWRACSPIWVDISPCGVSTVPVTMVCDQSHVSDCP